MGKIAMRSLVSALALAAALVPGLAWGDYVLPNTAANRARGVAGCTQTSSGISCMPSGGGGGGYSYGGAAAANMMMGLMNSFMQGVERGIQQQQAQRAAYGRQLNDQGIQLYNNGNYQGAFNAFNQALQYSPGDSNIRGNFNAARDALNQEREEAERRNRAQMEAAREKVQGMLGDLQASFGGDKSSTLSAGAPDMDFAKPQGTSFFGLGGGKPAAPPPATKPGDLAFVQSSDELFGKGSKGSAAPDLTGKSSDVPAFKLPPQKSGGLDFIPPDKNAPPPVNRKVMILLDALEDGNGDWEASRRLLEAQRQKNPKDKDVLAAIQDFNTAYKSAMEDAKKAGKMPTVDPRDVKGKFAAAQPAPPPPPKKESPPTSFDPGGWFPEGPPKAMTPRAAAPDTKPEVKEAQDLANQAFARYGKGDYEGAMQDLVKAVNLTPEDKWLTEAAKHVKFTARVDTYPLPERKVTELEKAQARRFAALGTKEMSEGDYDKAFQHFIDATNLDPNNVEYHRANSHALLGHILKGRQALTGKQYLASGIPSDFEAREDDSVGLLESIAAPPPTLGQRLKTVLGQ